MELSVLRETLPDPIYLAYATSVSSPLSTEFKVSPESPLHCPYKDYYTLTASRTCKTVTIELITLMRDLTNIFLEFTTVPTTGTATTTSANRSGGTRQIQPQRLSPNPFHGPQRQNPNHSPAALALLEARRRDIHYKLATFLSASRPGHTATGDWVYESIRLTALLYTHALRHKIPFSVAAGSRNLSTATSGADDSGGSTETLRRSSGKRPVDQGPGRADVDPRRIRECLIKTDLADCWNNMAGVLFWVALVAGAGCCDDDGAEGTVIGASSLAVRGGKEGSSGLATTARGEGSGQTESSSRSSGKGKERAGSRPTPLFATESSSIQTGNLTTSGVGFYSTYGAAQAAGYGQAIQQAYPSQLSRPQLTQHRNSETNVPRHRSRLSIATEGVQEEHEMKRQREYTRRWLVAVAVRCSILLRFEHTTAILQTLRKLVDVQSALGRR